MISLMQTMVDWQRHRQIVKQFSAPGFGPGRMSDEDLRLLQESLDTLIQNEDWSGILRLRKLYDDMMARDTMSAHPVTQKLSQRAIQSARRLNDIPELAHLLGAYGHNLHRQGYHQRALDAFEEASRLYEDLGDKRESLKNYFMMGSCYKGLGRIRTAIDVFHNVLESLEENDLWRGHPLQALAWIRRDQGYLRRAERLLAESLRLQRLSDDSDIVVAGTLADLGELKGMQGYLDAGMLLIDESLKILSHHQGQYLRQEARSKAKLASLLIKAGNHNEAMALLNNADDTIRQSAYYDEIWKIEIIKSLSYLRRLKFRSAFRKINSAWCIFQQLGTSRVNFWRQIMRRLPAAFYTPLLQRVMEVLEGESLEHPNQTEG